MTFLDLALISFSTYFTYSVLAAYSVPGMRKKPFLVICILSVANVLLLNNVRDLFLVYFTLAAAGIAYLLHSVKLEKLMPLNVNDNLANDNLAHQDPEPGKPGQSQAAIHYHNTDLQQPHLQQHLQQQYPQQPQSQQQHLQQQQSQQPQFQQSHLRQPKSNIKANLNNPSHRAAAGSPTAGFPGYRSAGVMPHAAKNQIPIVPKVTTVPSPITLNDFYKEVADSKMLLSDALVKRFTGKKPGKF